MYCRDDLISTKLIFTAFRNFSEASGLQVNTEKSSIYIARVIYHTKQSIIEALGFTEETL